VAAPHDEEALAKEMAGREIEVAVDLRAGHGEATVLTTDLSPGYIAENMRTS
jgi:glutamate N-acetyltransferase/amino-acid N-acetyltransferase